METLLIVTTGEGATGIQQLEARNEFKHPAMHRTAPTAKNDPALVSVVLWLRNPGLFESSHDGPTLNKR